MIARILTMISGKLNGKVVVINMWTTIKEGNGYSRLQYQREVTITVFGMLEDVLRIASAEAYLNPNLPKSYVWQLKDGRYSYDYFDVPFSGGHSAVYVDEHGEIGMDRELSESRIVCGVVRFPTGQKEIDWELVRILF